MRPLMENIFKTDAKYTVTEANINYYSKPFIHPKRKMKEYDFIYLLQGKWKIGQGDEAFELKKDSLLILTENRIHYGITPCEENTKTMYFHVFKEASKSTSDAFYIQSLTDATSNPNIKHYFSEVVNARLLKKQRKADLYFQLLLCELSEKDTHTPDFDIASKIKTIIHKNPEKFFKNAELAKMNNVSVKTAENKFKALFGVTIHQYILSFKIKEAVSYFDHFPNISVKEVASNLGFYDEYHFSKQFKRLLGTSPIAYKGKK